MSYNLRNGRAHINHFRHVRIYYVIEAHIFV